MNLEKNKLNQDWMRVDARILGQLLIAQNMLFVLSDEKRVEEYFAEALKIVPGISSCFACIVNQSVSYVKPFEECRKCCNSRKDESGNLVLPGKINCSFSGSPDKRIIALKTKDISYGFFIFKIESANDFEPYFPFLSNLANYVALSLENRIQKHLLEKANTEMEAKVNERTEQLRHANERLLLSTSAAHLGVWDWDIQKNELVWDDKMYELYGIKKGDFDGAYEAWLSGIHPDDRAESDEFSKLAQRGEKEYDTELRVIWPDGSLHYLKAYGQIVRNADGTPLRMTGINFDITERKMAEEALFEGQRVFQTLVENSPDIIARYDKECKRIYVNPTYLKEAKITKDELLTKSPLEHSPLPSESAIILNSLLDKVFRSGVADSFDILWPKEDGINHWYNVYASPEFDRDGEVMSVMTVSRDITERKLSELYLIESEKKFRSLAESSPDNIIRYNSKLQAVYINQNVQISAGEEVISLIGKTPIESNNHPGTLKYQKVLEEVIKTGKPDELEIVIPNLNGELRTHNIRFVPELNIDNKIIGALAFGRDITNNKLAEENLKLLNFALNNVYEEAYLINEKAAFHYVNDESCHVLGYSREELLKMTVPDIDPGFPIENWPEHWNNIKKKGSFVFETHHKTKKGSIYPVEISANYFEYHGQGYNLALVRDITERKNAEMKLAATTSRLNEAQRIAHIGSWELDILNNKLEWSEEIYKIFEVDPSTYSTSYEAFLDAIHPDDRNAVNIAYKNSLETRIPYSIDHRLLLADGHIKHVHEQCETVYSAEGEPMRSIGVVQDITERKKAEEKIIQLAAIVESSNDSIIGKTLDGIVTSWNKGAENLYGYTESEMIGNPISILDPPECENDMSIILEKLKIGEHIEHYETERIRKDGQRLYVSLTISPIEDADGKIIGASAIGHDITQRKRIEEELRSSDERYRLIAENTADTIVICDLELNPVYLSPSIFKLLGYTVQEAMKISVNQIFTPISVLKINAELSKQIALNKSEETDMSKSVLLEIEMYRKDLSVIWVELAASFLKDKNLRPTGILSVARNITDRKQSEEKLRMLSRAVEQSPASIVITDLHGNIEFVNSKFSKLTGYSLIEALQQNPRILKSGEMSQAHYKKMWQALTNGKDWHGEFHNKKKNGELYWEYASISPVFDSNGIITHFLAVKEDITDRKKAEVEIQKLNQELEKRVNERTAQLEVANKELEAFSYSVSHDLRAPLRAIDGFSLALLEEYENKLDIQGNNYLQRVRSGAQRMAQLIDDILSLSKVSRREMNIQQVDLSEIFTEVSKSLCESQPEREVKIIVQNGITTMGDGRLLRIVFENLVGNAWKYTSKHSTACIEFGMTHQEEMSVYFIRDDGAGFDMNFAHKLFGAFQRLHSTEDFPGTGIGLATVQRIIHRHGGEIWAKSEVEKGTTFYFTIP